MENNGLELVLRNPRGEIEAKRKYPLAPRIPDLSGKRIALIHNNKNGAITFLDAVEGLLKAKYSNLTFLRQYTTQPNLAREPEVYDEIAKNSDAFIFGAGD
jgi:hypothetical protein